MHTDAYGLRTDARIPRVFGDDVPINRAGIEVPVQRSGAQLYGLMQPGERGEFRNVGFVGATGFGIGDVGESFEFRGYVGEVAELGRR